MAYALAAMNVPFLETMMIPPFVCASPMASVGLGSGLAHVTSIPQLPYLGMTGMINENGTESSNCMLRNHLNAVEIKSAGESSTDSPKRKIEDERNEKANVVTSSSKKPKRSKARKSTAA